MEQKLIPFDLERALAGDPVQTRAGIAFTQAHKFDTNNPYCLAGVVGGEVRRYTKEGFFYSNGAVSNLDLFMAPKVREYWVNVWKGTTPLNSLYLGVEHESEKEAKDSAAKNVENGHKLMATIKLTEQI